jgi:lipid-binding SYLF domain-containing protein
LPFYSIYLQGDSEMKFSIRMMVLGAISAFLLTAFSANQAAAQKKTRLQDATRHSGAAAKVFTEIMNVRDKAIPKEMLDKAEAIAVFPGVVKAAFIFGGRGGQGVISVRTRNGWSPRLSST